MRALSVGLGGVWNPIGAVPDACKVVVLQTKIEVSIRLVGT